MLDNIHESHPSGRDQNSYTLGRIGSICPTSPLVEFETILKPEFDSSTDLPSNPVGIEARVSFRYRMTISFPTLTRP